MNVTLLWQQFHVDLSFKYKTNNCFTKKIGIESFVSSKYCHVLIGNVKQAVVCNRSCCCFFFIFSSCVVRNWCLFTLAMSVKASGSDRNIWLCFECSFHSHLFRSAKNLCRKSFVNDILSNEYSWRIVASNEHWQAYKFVHLSLSLVLCVPSARICV